MTAPGEGSAPSSAAEVTQTPAVMRRRSRLADRERESVAAEGLGLLSLLRRLEREGADRPRIGRNTRLQQSLVRLGQDPFLAFPDKDIARIEYKGAVPSVRAQFLGFFGAFGALPLNWSEEVQRWFAFGDESFVAFTDIFAARFQELFFRAWSDARPITQFDHPDDRFQALLLALTGTGTPAFRNRDGVPDTVKLRLLPLVAGQVKSPVRLLQMLQTHFGDSVTVEVEELVPSWLDFEPDALSCLGQQGSTLGRDVLLGSRTRSIGEKIRLHLRLRSRARYDRFLPGAPDHAQLRDLVFWYLGQAFEIEVLIWLPETEIAPARLGTAQLGWMACVAPPPGQEGRMVRVANYRLAPEGPARTERGRPEKGKPDRGARAA